VKDVSEAVFNTMVYQIVADEENPKFVLYYNYDDGQGAPLLFKALSADPLLQEDFSFMSISYASYELT
jgi:hypothetical protein